MSNQKPFALSARLVLSDRQGRILLLKRSARLSFCPSMWEFPGGKAELGEGFEPNLLREVDEETGLQVSIRHVAGAIKFELPERSIACILMAGDTVSDKVRLSDEHEQYAWVTPDRLLDYTLAEHFLDFARDPLPQSIPDPRLLLGSSRSGGVGWKQ